MTEYWANVYVWHGKLEIGNRWTNNGMHFEPHDLGESRFRIHVRLKPEGAPKRYRDAHNRFAWEFAEEACNRMVTHGFRPEDLR